MKRTCACIPAVLIGMLTLTSIAQVSAVASQVSASATISGIVLKDPGSEPVKKAVIELIAEDQRQGGNYTTVTNPDGTFRIDGIGPGRYYLSAEHTGYVQRTTHGGPAEGRILSITAGQDVRDVQIHFAAAATVSGRVTDEDGDPLENAEVCVLRRSFASGHVHWQQVRSERTNDLGEYRVSGLAAGNYYVSVNPPPDFKSLIESGNPDVSARSAHSADKPSASYQTTYYAGTPDRSQAEVVPLHAGDEFPANFSLTPSPTITVRGSVMNLPPGSSATVMLQSSDFNVVFNGAEVHKDGSFVIRDVSPGAYTVVASVDNTPVPMIARQSVQVTSTNVDGLRLVPQTGATIRGRLRVEATAGTPAGPSQAVLTLASADPDDAVIAALSIGPGGNSFLPMALVASDGTFQWNNVPAGNYSLHLQAEHGLATDWFLRSAVVGGRTTDPSAISVNGGIIALDVIASANGGIIEGTVTDSHDQPVSDAVIICAPEASLRLHQELFHKTTSDQNGRFSLHGIAPGQYSLFAWDMVDGDAYYDPDFLRIYEEQSTALRIIESDRKSVRLQVITTGEQQ